MPREDYASHQYNPDWGSHSDYTWSNQEAESYSYDQPMNPSLDEELIKFIEVCGEVQANMELRFNEQEDRPRRIHVHLDEISEYFLTQVPEESQCHTEETETITFHSCSEQIEVYYDSEDKSLEVFTTEEGDTLDSVVPYVLPRQSLNAEFVHSEQDLPIIIASIHELQKAFVVVFVLKLEADKTPPLL
ncbi:hypothetical protein ACOSP7_017034 [Xanthoceras sorbifolium]